MERFFSKVGVPFSINESPGYCPKLTVTWSICSQRSCLQNLATAFGLFLFSIFLFLFVEKLPLLDKVFRDFMTNIAKYREPKRNPENLFWTMYEEYDSVFLSPKSKSGDTYCTR